MQIIKEAKANQNILVKINLEAKDYTPQVEEKIKKYSKTVNLKGFRKGMVPKNLVKKMFGTEILVETINETVGQNLDTYIKEENLKILGSPLLNSEKKIDFDIYTDKNYEFEFEMGLIPEFGIKPLEKKSKVTRYKVKHDEAFINEEIEKTLKRFGEVEQVDKIEKDDIIKMDVVQIDKDGKPVADGVNAEASVYPDLFKDKKLSKTLLGKTVGDKLSFDPFKAFDREKEMIEKIILGLEPGNSDPKAKYEFEIKEVTRLKAAELNQELFDKIYGEGNVKTADEFKAKVEEELVELLKTEATQKLNADTFEMMLKETEVDLPEDFLKRWMEDRNQKEAAEGKEVKPIEEEFPTFIRSLKWNLIANQIATDNKIEVKPEEIQEETARILHFQYHIHEHNEMYGQFMEYFMKNEEHIRRVHDDIRDKKVFDYLADNLTIKEKEISYKEFKKLSEK